MEWSCKPLDFSRETQGISHVSPVLENMKCLDLPRHYSQQSNSNIYKLKWIINANVYLSLICVSDISSEKMSQKFHKCLF